MASCNIIMLFLVGIVVFIENRVRHNELERNMLRTISSVKKSYVRYVKQHPAVSRSPVIRQIPSPNIPTLRSLHSTSPPRRLTTQYPSFLSTPAPLDHPPRSYLSHELRTPLNTTWLGISLLSRMVSRKKEEMKVAEAAGQVVGQEEMEQVVEQMEILEGMSAGCKAAVDILSDMIEFDKLER